MGGVPVMAPHQTSANMAADESVVALSFMRSTTRSLLEPGRCQSLGGTHEARDAQVCAVFRLISVAPIGATRAVLTTVAKDQSFRALH